MNCPNCGAPVDPNSTYCQSCGARVGDPYQAQSQSYQASSYQGQSYQPQPNYVNNYVIQSDAVPPQYKPLSPWAYFGYNLLFAIPLVGLICLIVFSFNDDNINRRNYARSFFCALLIVVIFTVIIVVIAAATGSMYALTNNLF